MNRRTQVLRSLRWTANHEATAWLREVITTLQSKIEHRTVAVCPHLLPGDVALFCLWSPHRLVCSQCIPAAERVMCSRCGSEARGAYLHADAPPESGVHLFFSLCIDCHAKEVGHG